MMHVNDEIDKKFDLSRTRGGSFVYAFKDYEPMEALDHFFLCAPVDIDIVPPPTGEEYVRRVVQQICDFVSQDLRFRVIQVVVLNSEDKAYKKILDKECVKCYLMLNLPSLSVHVHRFASKDDRNVRFMGMGIFISSIYINVEKSI